MTFARTIAAAAVLSLFVASTFAQPSGGGISMDEARRIALQYGIVKIEDIELDDGNWEIEGRDISGREREIEIDARSGKIIKIETDD
jgi:uncharacterized membrane protein YkoI